MEKVQQDLLLMLIIISTHRDSALNFAKNGVTLPPADGSAPNLRY